MPTDAEEPSVPLAGLLPDPRNARRHNDRNLAQIEAALRDVGAGRSIVVDEAGVILAGNATVQA
ncbi:MAG: DNA methylase, partial [Chloroflexota bacterium]|nr:DNA methylase [Chloroflexota bacterium]